MHVSPWMSQQTCTCQFDVHAYADSRSDEYTQRVCTQARQITRSVLVSMCDCCACIVLSFTALQTAAGAARHVHALQLGVHALQLGVGDCNESSCSGHVSAPALAPARSTRSCTSTASSMLPLVLFLVIRASADCSCFLNAASGFSVTPCKHTAIADF